MIWCLTYFERDSLRLVINPLPMAIGDSVIVPIKGVLSNYLIVF
jgi:hypothetical protein